MSFAFSCGQFQATVSLAAVHRDVPAAVKAELEQVYRDHTGHDFDPAAEFRESAADADQYEGTYQARLREIQADWPERADDPLLQRLQSAVTPDIITQLTEELSQRLAAISPKPPG